MTREPYFYKTLSKCFRGDDMKIYQIFGVHIGNEKTTKKSQLHPAAPVMKYHQK